MSIGGGGGPNRSQRNLFKLCLISYSALSTLAIMASPWFRTSPFAVQVTDKVEGKCLRIDMFMWPVC